MRLIVAPEPAAWLSGVVRRGDVVVAPWATSGSLPEGVTVWRVPLWHWVRAGASRVTEPLALKLSVRRALDAIVATLVTSEVTEIIAPSMAAQRTFARLRHAKRVLMLDVPVLPQLHADLDIAARALPHCRYLKHHRASQAVLVQQLEECQLATCVKARSHFAAQRLRRAGIAPQRIEKMTLPAVEGESLQFSKHGPVLLAGTTASRSGLEVALEALAQRPTMSLVARAAVGSEPSSLRHPRLTVLSASDPFPPVSAVWAPAWVESSPGEVQAAVRAKIHVVATAQAMGWLEAGPRVTVLEPGVRLLRGRSRRGA